MSNNSKNILITGASSGIGETTTQMLVEKGYTVFAAGRKNLPPESENIIPLYIDVNDDESIKKAYEKIAEHSLYGLVNNAGIAVAGPMEFLPIEKLRLQLETNVIGQVNVIQTFLPLLRKSGGRIVNISSISGFISSPFVGAYCASKYAFEAISDSLRRELRPWGISVSLVQPGIIKTNIWERSFNLLDETVDEMPEDAKKHYGAIFESKIDELKDKIEKRGTSPEQVAKAVLQALSAKKPKTRYLVGPDAKMVNLLKYLPDKVLDRCICSYE